MSKKHIKIFIFTVSVLLFISCHKKTIILDQNHTYSVKQLLKSPNCKARCYKQADCETMFVNLTGVIKPEHIDSQHNRFYLYDQQDAGYSLEVQLPDSIGVRIFKYIRVQPDAIYLVSGMIEGFDAPTNFTCDRRFVMKVNTVKNIKRL